MDHTELEAALAAQPNLKLEVAMQKVNMQTRMAYKHGYSRPTKPKRHLLKLRELNDFLGRYMLKAETPDFESVSSHSSVENREVDAVIKSGNEKLTYKTLIDHI